MNTVRLGPELEARLRRVAREKGKSLSDVHREALEAYCAQALEEPKRSRYDDVIGVIEGPGDLSETVSERFTEGMMRKHGRHID